MFGEIFEEHVGQESTADDLDLFESHFCRRLDEAARSEPFIEVSGACRVLRKLQRENGWAVCIATGCFYESAALKFKDAEIDVAGIPIATSSDAISREDIVGIAIERALRRYDVEQFEKIISIGDGVWDIATSRNLGIDFIGVSSGANADMLINKGAEIVIEDFVDYQTFFGHLNK